MPTANFTKFIEKTIEIAPSLNVQTEEKIVEVVGILDISHLQNHFATKIIPLY